MWYTNFDKLADILIDIEDPRTPISIKKSAVQEARSRGVDCDETGRVDWHTVPITTIYPGDIFLSW